MNNNTSGGFMPTSQDFSNSSYHPSWESREFNQEQYKQELEKMSDKKAGSFLICDHHSFKRVGLISYIWQTIKGWFNSEIQTKPIQVNYELLKFLRTGQTHHFFNDADIKKLVSNLQTELPQTSPFDETVKIIKEIANAQFTSLSNATVETEINSYYAKHKSELAEPALVHLFHRISAPVAPNTAGVNYNLGRIHASEGRWLDAIGCFEKAIGMDAAKPEYQFALATNALACAKKLCMAGEIPKTLSLCDKSIKTANGLANDPLFDADAEQLLVEAFPLACAIHVKQNDVKTALAVLDQAQNSVSQTQRDLLAAIETLGSTFPALAATSTQQAAFYLSLAKQAQAADRNKATAFIEKAITAQHSSEAHVLAAELYLAQHKTSEALAHAKKAQALSSSDNEQAIIYLLYRCGEKVDSTDSKAIEKYKIILASHPNDADSHFQLGKLYLEDNRLAEALSHLNETRKLDPAHAGLDACLGRLYLKQNDFKQALAAYDRNPQAFSKERFACHAMLATDAQNRQDVPAALAHYEQALALSTNSKEIPADADIHFQLGKLYLQDNQLDKALIHLSETLKLNPKHAQAHACLGQLYLAQKDFEKALAEYDIAAARDAQAFSQARLTCHVALAIDSAKAVKTAHDYALMLDHFEKALNFSKDTAEKQNILLSLIDNDNFHLPANHQTVDGFDEQNVRADLLIEKHLDEADTDNKQILLDCYQRLGKFYKVRHEQAPAIAYFEKARALAPKEVPILKALADLHAAAHNFSLAEDLYNQLIELDARDTAIYRTALAKLHLTQNNFAKGLQQHLEMLTHATYSQKAATAAAILPLARSLFDANPLDALPLSAYKSIQPYIDQLDPANQKLDILTAYIALAQDATLTNDKQADAYYRHAVNIDPTFAPWKASWLFGLGNHYKTHGLIENAAMIYRKVHAKLLLQPDAWLDPAAFNKNVAETEIALGDLYYAKGVNDNALVKQMLADLADYAEKSQAIKGALGAHIGKTLGGIPLVGRLLAQDSYQLQSLIQGAKQAKTPYEFEEKGLALCSLMEKAYDGGKNHLARKDMPEALVQLIHTTREQISNRRDYYGKLQQKTQELVQAAKSVAAFSGAFAKWQHMPSTKDLKQATASEKKAHEALKLIDQVIQSSAEAKEVPKAPPALQESLKDLRDFLTPQAWNHLAIAHYKQSTRDHAAVVVKLLDHGQKLIDDKQWQMAFDTYQNALPFLTESDKTPQLLKNFGMAAREAGKLTEAVAYLQKAIAIQQAEKLPEDATLHYELAKTFNAQKDFDKTLQHLIRADALDFNPYIGKADTYKRDLYQAQLAVGNQKYARAILELQHQKLQDKIKDTQTTLDELKTSIKRDLSKIQIGLDPFSAKYQSHSLSFDTRTLMNVLEQPASNALELHQHAMLIIKLLNKARYKDNNIDLLKIKLPELLEAYSTFEKTPKQPLTPPIKDPNELLGEAFNHYSAAYKLNDAEHVEYFNKWIDTAVKLGKHDGAVKLHNILKAKYPQANLVLESKAYQTPMDKFLQEKEYGKALSFIDTAIQAFPAEVELKKQKSHLYVLLAQDAVKKGAEAARISASLAPLENICLQAVNEFNIAQKRNLPNLTQKRTAAVEAQNKWKAAKEKLALENENKEKYYNEAADFYVKAQGCGVTPEVACYSGLGALYAKACLEEDADFWRQAIDAYKEACKLDPKNSAYPYSIGELLAEHLGKHAYLPFVDEDPINYLQAAVKIDQKNEQYLTLLLSLARNGTVRRAFNHDDSEFVTAQAEMDNITAKKGAAAQNPAPVTQIPLDMYQEAKSQHGEGQDAGDAGYDQGSVSDRGQASGEKQASTDLRNESNTAGLEFTDEELQNELDALENEFKNPDNDDKL